MTDKGMSGLEPGKTNSEVFRAVIAFRIFNVRSDNGTRCSRAPFILWAGTVQIRSFKSISSHRAPITSPDRAAVRIRNSKAVGATPPIFRSWATNSGTSSKGIAL